MKSIESRPSTSSNLDFLSNEYKLNGQLKEALKEYIRNKGRSDSYRVELFTKYKLGWVGTLRNYLVEEGWVGHLGA